MSCCGQKISGHSLAIRALMDKALMLEEKGRGEDAQKIFEVLAAYYDKVSTKNDLKKHKESK